LLPNTVYVISETDVLYIRVFASYTESFALTRTITGVTCGGAALSNKDFFQHCGMTPRDSYHSKASGSGLFSVHLDRKTG